MKHFLNIQNGHIFALFLCIFTNFFLVLLIKKDFLRLLLCIFPNRQKKCRKPTRHCGQHASSGMHATCEQHTQTSISASKRQYSFSCQLLPILLLYRIQRLLAARLIPPDASRQTSRRRPSFLTSFFSYQPSQLTTPNNAKASASTNNTGSIFSYRANLRLPVSSNLTFANPFQLSPIPSSNLQTFHIPFLH